jgi:hypothetical protein
MTAASAAAPITPNFLWRWLPCNHSHRKFVVERAGVVS